MKVILASAVLAFTASAAFAECAGHVSAQSTPDPTVVASVEAEKAATPAISPADNETPVKPLEADQK